MTLPVHSTCTTSSCRCLIIPTGCSLPWPLLKRRSGRDEDAVCLLDACPETSRRLRRDRLDRTEAKHHTGACMKASLHRLRPSTQGKLVTNCVTNPMGNRGQCRATVTNFVTKLRA